MALTSARQILNKKILGGGDVQELEVEIAALSASVLTIGEKLENVTEASTTEHIVGKWVDGSDVYEKTIVINSLGYDTVGNFSEVGTIDNCAELLSLKGIIWNSAGNKARELPFISTELNTGNSKVASLTFEKTADHGNDNAIIFYSNDTWATAKLIMTVRYTKTAAESSKKKTTKKK